MSCKIRNHELTNPDVFQALAPSMAGLPESKRGWTLASWSLGLRLFIVYIKIFFAILKHIFCHWKNNKTMRTFFKSSRSQMFFKIGVFNTFTIFTGKHLCWSHFFIELRAWRRATLLKWGSNTGVSLRVLRNF